MNGYEILLSVVIMSNFSELAQADETKLGVTLDTTYVSKYIWHGFNFYGHDNAAIQPSVDMNLWETGFGVTFWSSWATKSGSKNLEEFDYIFYYSNSAFENTPYAMDYTINWLYYDFYDNATRDSDLQELLTQFSWPELFSDGIVPSYSVGKLWQVKSGSPALMHIGGWIHVLCLGYDLTLQGFCSDTPEQVVSLMGDLTYNDGYGATGADHDWSHATIGASTSFEATKNLNFIPAVYYQISMDNSINRDDEAWASLSLTYGF